MLVDLSNVAAVEIAQKERDAAFRVAEKEKRKAEAAKKKYQNEMKSRAKEEKKRSIKQKQEIRFWQCMTAIMLAATVVVSIWF